MNNASPVTGLIVGVGFGGLGAALLFDIKNIATISLLLSGSRARA